MCSNNRCYSFLFVSFFFILAFDSYAEIISTDEYVPELNNESLQKTFIRVEILQRRNQELQNRVERLENSNQALLERLKELSIEFDARIESLSLSYREFKAEVNQKLTPQEKEENKQENIVIDFALQDIYRQGIMAISLEKYQESISYLNNFLSKIDPKATSLIIKAKYWIAISLSKLEKYNESFNLLFEIEQQLISSNFKFSQVINLNQVRIEMLKALIGSKQFDQAKELIEIFKTFEDKELNQLIEPFQSELELAL